MIGIGQRQVTLEKLLPAIDERRYFRGGNFEAAGGMGFWKDVLFDWSNEIEHMICEEMISGAISLISSNSCY